MTKHLYVLPGGGSPHNTHYKKVYETIKYGGNQYGYEVKILDYCGCGHYPNYGKGLNIPTSSLKVSDVLKNAPKGSTLMGRCYGCNVITNILANEPETLQNFSKIVLWAIVLNEVWDNIEKEGITIWNKEHEKKGVQLAKDYFATLNNALDDAKKINHKNIIFGYGTNDNNTTRLFNETLAKIINNNGGKARVISINNAEHAIIKGSARDTVINQYFNLIFKI